MSLDELDDETFKIIARTSLNEYRHAQLRLVRLRKLVRPVLDECERRGINPAVEESLWRKGF